jgi:hypothetical protein
MNDVGLETADQPIQVPDGSEILERSNGSRDRHRIKRATHITAAGRKIGTIRRCVVRAGHRRIVATTG